MDLSFNGLKLYSKLELHNDKRNIVIQVNVQLNNYPIDLTGEVIWKKQKIHGFLYGIRFLDENEEFRIKRELKKYVNMKSKSEEEN